MLEKEITGVMIYYYKVCTRKLWYFYHEIQMEQTNENVAIGKVLDDEVYSKEDKHINIDNVINIDFIKTKSILHEIKKSKKIEDASILQVKYYLYYLKKRGVYGITAKIDYPMIRQSVEVALADDDEKNIEAILLDTRKIVEKNIPPNLIKKGICKSCAYFDLCYI